METIKPLDGDIVEWNGICPLTNEVLNVLPDGVVIDHCGGHHFIPHGSYRVVAETGCWGWYFKRRVAIRKERIAEGFYKLDT